jgi:hypothetical protein
MQTKNSNWLHAADAIPQDLQDRARFFQIKPALEVARLEFQQARFLQPAANAGFVDFYAVISGLRSQFAELGGGEGVGGGVHGSSLGYFADIGPLVVKVFQINARGRRHLGAVLHGDALGLEPVLDVLAGYALSTRHRQLGWATVEDGNRPFDTCFSCHLSPLLQSSLHLTPQTNLRASPAK